MHIYIHVYIYSTSGFPVARHPLVIPKVQLQYILKRRLANKFTT